MNQVKYWNPSINDEIEGILVDKLDDVGKYHNRLYKIRINGEIINIWGKAQLDSIMQTAKIGDKILLRYVGTKPIHDYEMKVYELEILNEQSS